MTEQTKLIIKHNKPAGFLLPQTTAKGLDKKEQAGFLLMPGENNVSKAYWDFCKKNPAVKIALVAEDLEECGEGKAKPINVPWKKVSLPKAKALIKKITSVTTLNKIKKEAGKKGIIDLCEMQIARLTDIDEEDE